jgi:hypothetical protein
MENSHEMTEETKPVALMTRKDAAVGAEKNECQKTKRKSEPPSLTRLFVKQL